MLALSAVCVRIGLTLEIAPRAFKAKICVIEAEHQEEQKAKTAKNFDRLVRNHTNTPSQA